MIVNYFQSFPNIENNLDIIFIFSGECQRARSGWQDGFQITDQEDPCAGSGTGARIAGIP
jgi:hypothetical protein